MLPHTGQFCMSCAYAGRNSFSAGWPGNLPLRRHCFCGKMPSEWQTIDLLMTIKTTFPSSGMAYKTGKLKNVLGKEEIKEQPSLAIT